MYHCQLNLHFSHIKYLVICLMAIHVFSVVKCLLKSCATFTKLSCLIMLEELLIYSRYKYFDRYMFCKYFLTVCYLPFQVCTTGMDLIVDPHIFTYRFYIRIYKYFQYLSTKIRSLFFQKEKTAIFSTFFTDKTYY